MPDARAIKTSAVADSFHDSEDAGDGRRYWLDPLTNTYVATKPLDPSTWVEVMPVSEHERELAEWRERLEAQINRERDTTVRALEAADKAVSERTAAIVEVLRENGAQRAIAIIREEFGDGSATGSGG